MESNITSVIRKYPRNLHGRDFVLGDIHGEFSLVYRALDRIDFDPSRDRLFSVGDLIDRGPESEQVIDFLARPYVYAVCGNHEDMLIQSQSTQNASAEPTTWGNGSEWWLETSPDIRQQIYAALKQLPLAIEIETARGKVGIIHAEVPHGMDWQTFCDSLEAGDEETIYSCLWERTRIRTRDESGVRGVGRLFVGHSPQMRGLSRLGNIYYVDTGAFYKIYGGHLTLINMQISTKDAVREIEIDERLGVRDGSSPSDPFGQYAL